MSSLRSPPPAPGNPSPFSDSVDFLTFHTNVMGFVLHVASVSGFFRFAQFLGFTHVVAGVSTPFP